MKERGIEREGEEREKEREREWVSEKEIDR